jgi:hypothetical protein
MDFLLLQRHNSTGIDDRGLHVQIYSLPGNTRYRARARFRARYLPAAGTPSNEEVSSSAQQAIFKADFHKKLPGSDFLHWGEGQVSISPSQVSFMGMIAPGPDYQLYLTPTLAQTEAEFLRSRTSR